MNNEDFKVVLSDKEYIEKLEKEVHYQNKEVSRLNKLLDETRLSELHKEYIINELENIRFEIIEEKNKKIERLNNIINELEKWLIERIDEYRDMEQEAMFEFGLVLDKLKELKENK